MILQTKKQMLDAMSIFATVCPKDHMQIMVILPTNIRAKEMAIEFASQVDALPDWIRPLKSKQSGSEVVYDTNRYLFVCNSLSIKGRSLSAAYISVDVTGKDLEECIICLAPSTRHIYQFY